MIKEKNTFDSIYLQSYQIKSIAKSDIPKHDKVHSSNHVTLIKYRALIM